MTGYLNIACVPCLISIFPLSHHHNVVLSCPVFKSSLINLILPPPKHHRSSQPRCLTLRTWKTWWVWKMASGALGASLWQSRSWKLQSLGLHPMTSLLSWRAAYWLRLASQRATDLRCLPSGSKTKLLLIYSCSLYISADCLDEICV